MRLTLRTLLAYLDGILEPNDAQDIGKKIEDSEFATDLVHRIRDVMRRLRLGAPNLTDQRARLDLNTVAEYLDNTLDAEGVTEFEKVCLDSDIHLAEVGSAHQILTLVLGEPAEIDPASRQRMYLLTEPPPGPPPTIPTAEATQSTSMVVLPPTLDLSVGDGETAERKPRPRPTVPEYLREPRKPRRWVPATVALVLAASLVVVVLNAFGELEPDRPVGRALVRLGLMPASRDVATLSKDEPIPIRTGRRGVASPPEKGTGVELTAEKPAKNDDHEATAPFPPKASAPKPAQELPPESVKEKPSGKEADNKKEAGKGSAEESAKEPPKPPLKDSNAGATKEPGKAPMAGAVLKPEAPAPGTTATAEPAAGASHAEASKEAAAKSPADAIGKVAAKSMPKSVPPPAVEPAGLAAGEAVTPPEAKTPAVPLPPEAMGRLLSSDQVLLKDDPAAGGWVRVAANEMLMPQRLLVLPTYRAQVPLVGVTLEILGGTELELLAATPQEIAGVRVLYGRVVLMPLTKAGSRLRVVFGGRGGVITFPDAESVAALEVRRIQPPGTNPEIKPPHTAASLYASTGGVLWDELGGGAAEKPLRLAAPQFVTFNGTLTSVPAASNELPPWILGERIGLLERRASLTLTKELATGRLARIGLLELYTSRPQEEVKWLALRSLGYVGQFRDMVAALNDPTPARRLKWPDYIDQLREAVARDAESAVAVRNALQKNYPQQAAQLYRMLWGYSDKDLRDGEDKVLVSALDDDTLAVRVLSAWNLHELTGLGVSYRPEQTAAKRQQWVARWRQRLKAGEIRLKTPEEKAGATDDEKVAPPAAEPGK